MTCWDLHDRHWIWLQVAHNKTPYQVYLSTTKPCDLNTTMFYQTFMKTSTFTSTDLSCGYQNTCISVSMYILYMKVTISYCSVKNKYNNVKPNWTRCCSFHFTKISFLLSMVTLHFVEKTFNPPHATFSFCILCLEIII